MIDSTIEPRTRRRMTAVNRAARTLEHVLAELDDVERRTLQEQERAATDAGGLAGETARALDETARALDDFDHRRQPPPASADSIEDGYRILSHLACEIARLYENLDLEQRASLALATLDTSSMMQDANDRSRGIPGVIGLPDDDGDVAQELIAFVRGGTDSSFLAFLRLRQLAHAIMDREAARRLAEAARQFVELRHEQRYAREQGLKFADRRSRA